MRWFPAKFTLRGRIFFSMLIIIAASFLVTGMISYYHFRQENIQYHEERLRRKEVAVLEAINFFLRDQELSADTDSIVRLFDNKVCELAQINDLDINIYSLNGGLLIASNPELHESGIIPTRINHVQMERLYRVGDQILTRSKNDSVDFLSSFDFIRNYKGKPVAIINLPYFDQRDVGQEDLRNFLFRLAEIYLLLFIAAAFISYFLSNYITSSLQTIGERIKNTRINQGNKELSWKYDDEIGTLVREYNRMLQELERSAVKLAQTERESAWREMAKQVAHEIKNPLTPMRLNVQYLQRSLQTDDPEKLKEFAESMIGQIDTLSSIAEAFSRFASMPELKFKTFPAKEVVQRVAAMYPDQNLSFEAVDEEFVIYADQDQLIRVMNNLINNAFQAIPEERKPEVKVQMEGHQNELIIRVIDNGCGIPEEQKEKVFEPRFTTKTKGMGLGLSLVKRIIDGFKGRIYFDSIPDQGTTFTIHLPIHATEKRS